MPGEAEQKEPSPTPCLSIVSISYNTMDQRLIDVANAGDVNAFYALLGEDQYILEGIDIAPFVDTPLHIAIEAENTAFALEIANLKPSFARKLNHAGFSPIHLASTYGNLKIVRKLLSKDHDLCLLEGRGNGIPLHFAAEAGNVDVMEALLKDCPDSIGMLTVREETPLHLAARNGKVRACEVLLKSIKKLNRWELMNWRDEDGNTAQDVVAGSHEVVDLLQNEYLVLERRNFLVANATRKVKAWMDKPVTNDSRGAMLVVLAVIITASFQAVVSPPGGVWQDSNSSNINNANTTSTAAAIAHYAGKAVMGQQYPNFVLINAIGFCASIWATILLTIDIPLMLQLLLMGCFAPMMIIYHLSVRIINPEEDMRGIAFTYVAIVITSIICIYTVARRVSQWRSRDLR